MAACSCVRPPHSCCIPSPAARILARIGINSDKIRSNRRSSATKAAEAAAMAAVIVGGGRVGLALEKMGTGKDTVVRRGQSLQAENLPGPIFVCTRNNDLDAVVDATPQHRRQDLVFFQNGMLEPWLERRGLADATQVLVYFAVAKVGEAPVDGKTDKNPEGLTAACGKWASAVATRLHSAGLSCKVLDAKEFVKPLLEKLIWVCAFMLVGARHPGATVGDVEQTYQDEVCSLIRELAAAASSVKGLTFDSGLEDRLCAYSRTVAHFPTAVKEFEWRNGWFYGTSQEAIASGKPDPCPLHTAWLQELAEFHVVINAFKGRTNQMLAYLMVLRLVGESKRTMAEAWSIRRAYLALYNCILCAGWVHVLACVVAALKHSGYSAVYDAAQGPLQIWQSAALLEIFNSLVGIVHSPVSATLPQIASRIYVTWGVLWSFPETRKHWLVAVLLLSWSITEVIRYSFFALKEAFGWTPAFLQWLRYSTFFILYPTGISGEVGLTLLALPFMKASDLYSLKMPNLLNFGFSYLYASVLVLLCYVPGSPFMYTYMIGQRNKTLARASKKNV